MTARRILITGAGRGLGRSHALAFALWPTAWRFLDGHQMKLELTQVDAPSWRPDNLSSSITFTKVRLELPSAA